MNKEDLPKEPKGWQERLDVSGMVFLLAAGLTLLGLYIRSGVAQGEGMAWWLGTILLCVGLVSFFPALIWFGGLLLGKLQQKLNFELGPCVILFFFFAQGPPIRYFFVVDPYFSSFGAKDWVNTPCTIQAVTWAGGLGEGPHRVTVDFRHSWEGLAYTANTYGFQIVEVYARKTFQRYISRYPKGSTSTCWVNPTDPQEAVMRREVDLGTFPLVVIVVPATKRRGFENAEDIRRRVDGFHQRRIDELLGIDPGGDFRKVKHIRRRPARDTGELVTGFHGQRGVDLAKFHRQQILEFRHRRLQPVGLLLEAIAHHLRHRE